MDYLEDPFMIKMNCEGCEWEILKGSLESLKKFQVIIIYYHEEDYRNMVNKLRGINRCKQALNQ
ncbi:MAG: hypothetical protein DJ555_04390 [Desulfurococcaceae archaeon]|nr:MAG: hypothetical protein DJ555_04390 [Desulfurococcaceae archaeon]